MPCPRQQDQALLARRILCADKRLLGRVRWALLRGYTYDMSVVMAVLLVLITCRTLGKPELFHQLVDVIFHIQWSILILDAGTYFNYM